MFDVTSSEFLVIAIVAFLVLGPRRLPELFRKAGAWYGQLQRSAAELRSGLEAELDETARPLAEIQEDLDDVAAAAQQALEDGGTPPADASGGEDEKPGEGAAGEKPGEGAAGEKPGEGAAGDGDQGEDDEGEIDGGDGEATA